MESQELKQLTAQLKARLADAEGRLLANYQCGLDGLALARARAQAIDEAMALATAALFSGGLEGKYALFAAGGYGRSELCPRSDIDLLFVFHHLDDDLRLAFARCERALWDAGLQPSLGHLCLGDFSAAAEDITTATSMLSARRLAGDKGMAEELSGCLDKLRQGRGPALARNSLEPLFRSGRDRLRDVCRLQPDLKRDPYMLRDIHRLLWTEAALGHGQSIDVVANLPCLEKSGPALREGYAYYLRARAGLHLASTRRQEVLEIPIQERLAADFGFVNNRGEAEPAAFLRDFYRKVRGVAEALRLYASHCRINQTIFPAPRERLERRQMGPGLICLGKTLYLSRESEGLLGFPPNPELLFKPFEWTLQTGGEVSDEVIAAVRETVSGLDSGQRKALTQWSGIKDFLGSSGQVARALMAMHESGLLEAAIPEFAPLTCAAIHDYLHEYTIDSHTLLALWEFDDIEGGTLERGGDEGFHRLCRNLGDLAAFRFALLLHDCAKPLGSNHAVNGAILAKQAALRHGFSPEQAELVDFLVRQHLAFSNLAQRSDPTDREVAGRLATLCSTRERLNALLLLTRCDISATSPANWTGYLAEQLWILYSAASACLEEKDARETDFEASLALLRHQGESDLSLDEILRHCELMGRRAYRDETPFKTILQHAALAARHTAGQVEVEWEEEAETQAVCFASDNRRGLLRGFVAVLTACGMEILSARGATRKDGIAIETFAIRDAWKGGRISAERRASLEKRCADLAAGRLDADTLVRQHLKSHKPGMPPHGTVTAVDFDNTASSTYTRLRVRAPDRAGLLYDMASAIFSCGLEAWFITIATQANQADDIFYVLGQNGGKVSEQAEQERIRLCILGMVS